RDEGNAVIEADSGQDRDVRLRGKRAVGGVRHGDEAKIAVRQPDHLDAPAAPGEGQDRRVRMEYLLMQKLGNVPELGGPARPGEERKCGESRVPARADPRDVEVPSLLEKRHGA